MANAHLDTTGSCAACAAVLRCELSVDLSGESQPLCQWHFNMLFDQLDCGLE